jgi:hypothetical protein
LQVPRYAEIAWCPALYKILWSLRAWAANDLGGKVIWINYIRHSFSVFFSLIFTGREFTFALPNPSSYLFFSSCTNNISCEERLHFTSHLLLGRRKEWTKE